MHDVAIRASCARERLPLQLAQLGVAPAVKQVVGGGQLVQQVAVSQEGDGQVAEGLGRVGIGGVRSQQLCARVRPERCGGREEGGCQRHGRKGH
eukprot:6879929-Prymnesium_polylepis.2